MKDIAVPIEVQAHLHHQFFIGLQLMVAVEEGKDAVGEWIFRIFRQQHKDKFLPSFNKLGLDDLPDAVACAKYHVLSNSVGGVRVEYMAESDTKSWVRFRYPRWMYDGPAICGIPIEASRGFLRGWYAQNGISLKNKRLGFVCVSEDLTGQFGFCGYFKEYNYDLSKEERLQFSPDEIPPPFEPALQPSPPPEHWNEERLVKAARNYSVEFCRNGICELAGVIGRARTLELGKRAARLTGLQQFKHMADKLGCIDGDVSDAAQFLATVLQGMGDQVTLSVGDSRRTVTLRQEGLRIVRGMGDDDRATMLSCWTELWRGAVSSHRAFIEVKVQEINGALVWRLSPRD
jgi:hypothetical protein